MVDGVDDRRRGRHGGDLADALRAEGPRVGLVLDQQDTDVG